MTQLKKNIVTINFKWLNSEKSRDLSLPSYETTGSAGMDVAANLDHGVSIAPGDIVVVPTGLAVEIPEGYEMQVRPRSGLAINHGITLVNAPGTIDSDYRGEIRIGLINLGKKAVTINRGDRIAQLIVAPVVRVLCHTVDSLSLTERGSGGFGHTGVK